MRNQITDQPGTENIVLTKKFGNELYVCPDMTLSGLID